MKIIAYACSLLLLLIALDTPRHATTARTQDTITNRHTTRVRDTIFIPYKYTRARVEQSWYVGAINGYNISTGTYYTGPAIMYMRPTSTYTLGYSKAGNLIIVNILFKIK